MTGELISIFEEAKHEALLYLIQKQWDMHLIKAWREHPFLRMSDCASDFEKKIIDVTPGRLKRFPVYKKTHFSLSVSRFFAALLPKTNSALWDGKPDTDVMAIMSKEHLLHSFADRRKCDAERYERNKARKALAAADAERRAQEDHNGKCARRNWSAVK